MYVHEYLQTRSNYWTMNFQSQCIHMHPYIYIYIYIYYLTLNVMYPHSTIYASASYNLCPYVLVHCNNYTSWHKNNRYIRYYCQCCVLCAGAPFKFRQTGSSCTVCKECLGQRDDCTDRHLPLVYGTG